MNKEKQEKKSILQKELSTKEVLTGLGIFGAVLVYGFVFIYPKYQEYKSIASTLNSVETEITQYENRISEMPMLQEKLDDLDRELKVKSKKLSHNMEDGMFLIGLSKLMDDVSVDLIEYSMEESIPYDTFYAIPTTVSVRGDYRHIREIMYYLEEQKNMTQILDYTMQTYIPEENNTENTNNVTTSIVPDAHVYWTESGVAYHKQECTVLEEEKVANTGKYLEGAPSASNKNAACQVCKPYTEVKVNQPQTTTTTKPKSKGEIEATFKFIMYSSDNPRLELENDDASKWKPGKYNPFTTTSR